MQYNWFYCHYCFEYGECACMWFLRRDESAVLETRREYNAMNSKRQDKGEFKNRAASVDFLRNKTTVSEVLQISLSQ